MVNYMANCYGTPYSFYSFCKILERDDYWGVQIDGHSYCAIMLGNEKMPNAVSDEHTSESEQIQQGLVYAAMLRGSDNTSYIKRFTTAAEMSQWARTVSTIDLDDSLLYYNS